MCTVMFKKNSGDKLINHKDLNQVIESYGYDPFDRIEEFILREVIPKYGCLTSVHRSNTDECGFPAMEFYIRYNVRLSFDEWLILRDKVAGDIREFCSDNGLSDAFHECCIFVTISGDAIE